jgi:hypothetical protein
MPARRTRRLVFTAFALAALAAPAWLAPGPAGAAKARIVLPETDAQGAPTARARASVTPAIDAMRELSPGVYEGIVPVRMPDGSWHVDLDERFHMVSVAHRLRPGGPLGRSCVHGAGGVAAWQSSVRAVPQVVTPAGAVPAKWEAR